LATDANADGSSATADEKTAATKAYDDYVAAPADDTSYANKKAELDAKLEEAKGEITSKETLLGEEAKTREEDAYRKLKETRDAKYYELEGVKTDEES